MRHTLVIISFLLTMAFTSTCQSAVILQYHHIDNTTPKSTSISPEIFKQQMAYLAEHDFTVWSLARLIDAIKRKETLPDKVVAITFDDGYESVAKHALPILRQYRFPFTVFINPTLVGGNIFMDWTTLKRLRHFGGSVANHAYHHPHLVRRQKNETEQEWQQRIRDELIDAENSIVKHMGQASGFLAYPYGEFNNAIKSMVKDLGMIAFAQHSGAFEQHVDLQEIPRFAFGGNYVDMSSFIDKVNSLPMPIKSVHVTDSHGNTLDEPLLPLSESRPTLMIELHKPELTKKVNCFASGQGPIAVKRREAWVITQAEKDLPVGRSRINCTATSSTPGRFYWYSRFFMRKNRDGSWYQEP